MLPTEIWQWQLADFVDFLGFLSLKLGGGHPPKPPKIKPFLAFHHPLGGLIFEINLRYILENGLFYPVLIIFWKKVFYPLLFRYILAKSSVFSSAL